MKSPRGLSGTNRIDDKREREKEFAEDFRNLFDSKFAKFIQCSSRGWRRFASLFDAPRAVGCRCRACDKTSTFERKSSSCDGDSPGIETVIRTVSRSPLTHQLNRLAPQIPQIPNVAFVLVERNRMQLRLNLPLRRRCAVTARVALIHVHINVDLTTFRQLYDVVNVEEQNQVNVRQHQLQDSVDEPERNSLRNQVVKVN